jgi:hypothetical protein
VFHGEDDARRAEMLRALHECKPGLPMTPPLFSPTAMGMIAVPREVGHPHYFPFQRGHPHLTPLSVSAYLQRYQRREVREVR